MPPGPAAKQPVLAVESAVEAERAGALPQETPIGACRERSRTIVMTTVATAAGRVPTAPAPDEGSECRAPKGITVVDCPIGSMLRPVPVVRQRVDDFESRLMPEPVRLVVPRTDTRAIPALLPEEARDPA